MEIRAPVHWDEVNVISFDDSVFVYKCQLLFIQNISPILIGWKQTFNSPKPVADDQIWKNFVFNEEMTSTG